MNKFYYIRLHCSEKSNKVIPYYLLQYPMPSSRLTKKHQATIPKEICTFLDLDSGDTVLFSVEKGKVVVRKCTPLDLEYLRATEKSLEVEWSSSQDSKAYDDSL